MSTPLFIHAVLRSAPTYTVQEEQVVDRIQQHCGENSMWPRLLGAATSSPRRFYKKVPWREIFVD
jgi:hypothetical protein